MTTKQFSTTATAVSSLHEDVRELCTHYVRTHTYTSECDVEVVYIMLIMPTPANTGVVIPSYVREICASACGLTNLILQGSFCYTLDGCTELAAKSANRFREPERAGRLARCCIEAAWNLLQLPHLVAISNANAPAHNPLQAQTKGIILHNNVIMQAHSGTFVNSALISQFGSAKTISRGNVSGSEWSRA